MQINKNESFCWNVFRKCFRKRHYSDRNECNSGVLQQTFSSSKTREKMETSNRSKCSKHVSICPNIQNGDGRGHQKLHLQGGMGSVLRSDRCVFSYLHTSKVLKSSTISCGRSFFSVQSPTFWYSNSSTQIHPCNQKGKAHASKQRHSDTPVPRLWFLQAPSQQICMEQSK